MGNLLERTNMDRQRENHGNILPMLECFYISHPTQDLILPLPFTNVLDSLTILEPVMRKLYSGYAHI